MSTRMYEKVANAICADVLSLRFGVSGALPESSHLMQMYEASKTTIRDALIHLQAQHIIEKKGHSYYANQSLVLMTRYVPPLPVRFGVDKKGYTQNLSTVVRIPLPYHIADRIGVPYGTLSVYRSRVGGELAGEGRIPSQISYYHYILPVSDEQIERMNNDATVDILFESAPVRMQRHDEISWRLPTEKEAETLLIPVTSPVGSLFIINRDMSNKVLLSQELVLAPRVTLVHDYAFDNRPQSAQPE